MVATGTDPLRGERYVWQLLRDVPDPEIPVVSVVDLGIVRHVAIDRSGVVVDVAPTYSGCPATEVIEDNIKACLEQEDLGEITIRRVLSPPWTTDWISAEGKEKLLAYGIAPPVGGASKRDLLGKPDIAVPVVAPPTQRSLANLVQQRAKLHGNAMRAWNPSNISNVSESKINRCANITR